MLFKEQLKQGARLQLTFFLPGSKAGLSVSSKVVWVRQEAGQREAGIIFTSIQDINKEIISKFIDENYRKKEETGGAK